METERKTPILYIDDDPENLLGFKLSFSNQFSIYTSKNTEEAYLILKNTIIAVVLVDYKMPVEDGIAFVDRIRREFPNVVFILVSAWAEVYFLIKALNMNCFFGFIQKPWNHLELSQMLQNASKLFYIK
jgi:YesN/AraC family two-component response regulator